MHQFQKKGGERVAKGQYKHKEGKGASRFTHGLIKTRLYRIWSNMKTRCFNPKATRFERYGARGIKVCDEWKNDFQAFYNWALSHEYVDNLTIDRIDVNGNYEPSNCRWVTYTEQNKNKSCVPKYELDGISFTQSDVEKLFGVKRTTFQARLKRGSSVRGAIYGQ